MALFLVPAEDNHPESLNYTWSIFWSYKHLNRNAIVIMTQVIFYSVRVSDVPLRIVNKTIKHLTIGMGFVSNNINSKLLAKQFSLKFWPSHLYFNYYLLFL